MYDTTSGALVIDFTARFPHKFWLSTWSDDDQYPEGFRYKLLSARPEPDGPIELVVLLEESSGDKSELTRVDVSPSAFDRTAATFVDGLTEEYGIEFEEIDATGTRTLEDFERLVGASGWHATDFH